MIGCRVGLVGRNSVRHGLFRGRSIAVFPHPVVLSVNGKAELVVQDTVSYQKPIELAERAESMDALKASVEDMKSG